MNPDMMPEMHDTVYTADDWKLTRALAIGWLAECANNLASERHSQDRVSPAIRRNFGSQPSVQRRSGLRRSAPDWLAIQLRAYFDLSVRNAPKGTATILSFSFLL